MQEQLLHGSLAVADTRRSLDGDPAGLLHDLIGATTLGSYDRACQAYRSAHRRGVVMLRAIENYLTAQDWTKCVNPRHLKVFGTLASLARDIDEAASDQIMARCLPASSDRLFRLRWDSIRRFSIAGFTEYSVRGIRLYVARDLKNHEAKAALIDEWLGCLPAEDFRGIERLYVVPARDDMDYAGRYVPILFVVTIVWNPIADAIINEFEKLAWIPRWLRYSAEKHTLYHEIGHHVHCHTWGQDPDQERQAETYAWSALIRCHPFSWGLIYWVVRIIPRPLRRRIFNRKR